MNVWKKFENKNIYYELLRPYLPICAIKDVPLYSKSSHWKIIITMSSISITWFTWDLYISNFGFWMNVNENDINGLMKCILCQTWKKKNVSFLNSDITYKAYKTFKITKAKSRNCSFWDVGLALQSILNTFEDMDNSIYI